MPVFANPERKYLVSVSLKVMFSSLAKQPVLRKTRWNRKNLIRLFFLPDWRHFLIVRNPYMRCLSFYKNKLVAIDLKNVEKHGWQHCQRLFFRLAGVQKGHRQIKIKRRLERIRFPQMVAALPDLFFFDAHLTPQSDLLFKPVQFRGFRIPLPVDRIFSMETHLEHFGIFLGLDPTIRENPSEDYTHEEYYDRPSLDTVYQLYMMDFIRFGYPQI